MFRRRLSVLSTFLAAGLLISCGGGGAPEPPPTASRLNWFTTCGDPVCGGYRGPFEGVRFCTTEKEGDLCTTASAQCDPKDACNARLLCAQLDPKQQAGGCPISRARDKQDIRYLSAAQKQQILEEIEALRLATYRYRSGGTDGPPRLGFLIDDVERDAAGMLATSALNAERDQVDLYGYISMVVAALQVQGRRIALLQAEVETLKQAMVGRDRSDRRLSNRLPR
jgi:hypothetical protein